MKPDLILQSDLLDILFENRNKEYGAYELRSHYGDRMQKSLAAILMLVGVIVAASLWKNNFYQPKKKGTIPTFGDSVRITPVIIPHETPLAEIPPKKFATVKDVTYRIVKNVEETIIPPTEEKEIKNIGRENIEGLLPGDMPQKASMELSGKGGVTPAQDPPSEEGTILERSEIMPEFPGGMTALQRFLSRNLKTPEGEAEAGTRVRVIVRFVVSKDGTVTGIEVEQSGGKDFDNEVLRVINKMPSWRPGSQNGKNVAVYFKIPIQFQMEEGN